VLTDLFSSTLVLFNFLQLSTLFYFICFLDVVVTFAHKWKIYFTILFFLNCAHAVVWFTECISYLGTLLICRQLGFDHLQGVGATGKTFGPNLFLSSEKVSVFY